MKNWLLQKEEERANLFQELIEISQKTLKEFNEEEKKDVCVRIIFSKDRWVDGNAKIEFLEKNLEDGYNVIGEYQHSIYNKNRDIPVKNDLFKLMSKGLFTNAWFSTLDNSRTYDAEFILSEKEVILENENCEYLENRVKQTHSGLNIQIGKQKKLNK